MYYADIKLYLFLISSRYLSWLMAFEGFKRKTVYFYLIDVFSYVYYVLKVVKFIHHTQALQTLYNIGRYLIYERGSVIFELICIHSITVFDSQDTFQYFPAWCALRILNSWKSNYANYCCTRVVFYGNLISSIFYSCISPVSMELIFRLVNKVNK